MLIYALAPMFFLAPPTIVMASAEQAAENPLSVASIVSILGAITTILTVLTGFLMYRLSARKAKLEEVGTVEERYRARIQRLQADADKWRIAHSVLLGTEHGRGIIISVDREYSQIYGKE